MMFIVNIKWTADQEGDDSFSYESLPLAISETEKFLSGRLDKPVSVDVYEAETKFSPNRKHVVSLRILR